MTTTTDKAAAVRAVIDQAHGTGTFWKHWLPGIVYTDGVKGVAEEGGAFWLIDTIASHLPRLWTQELVAFRLRVVGNTAHLTGTAANDTEVVNQRVEFTDFPLDFLEVWAEPNGQGWTIYLPSER